MFYQWIQVFYIFMQRRHQSHKNGLHCRNQNCLVFYHIPDGVHLFSKIHLTPTFFFAQLYLQECEFYLCKDNDRSRVTDENLRTETRDENDFDFFADWFPCPDAISWLACLLDAAEKIWFCFLLYSSGTVIHVSFAVWMIMINRWIIKCKAVA